MQWGILVFNPPPESRKRVVFCFLGHQFNIFMNHWAKARRVFDFNFIHDLKVVAIQKN